MKAKKIILITLLLTILINNASCSIVETETPVLPQMIPSVSSTTPEPTINTSVAKTDFSCWDVKPLYQGNDIKGSFVYAHYESVPQEGLPKSNNLFAWNISSFSSKRLNLTADIQNLLGLEGFISNSQVNTNKVILLTENNLILVSNQAANLFSLPQKADIFTASISNYFQNGSILITKATGSDNYQEGIGYTDTYYLFDPITNTISVHKVFLPKLYTDYQTGIDIYYSPDMNYVLYRSGEYQFSLLDIKNNKLLWIIPPKNSNLNLGTYGDPHWLPNQNVVTVEFEDRQTGFYKHYLMFLDGKYSPLINTLNEEFGPSIGVAQNGLAADWSPNERYLVSTYNTLIIWDKYEKSWYKPCIPDEQKSINSYMPLWSSDGNYFIATITLVGSVQANPYDYIVKKYLLDIDNKVIYVLPENVNQSEFPDLYQDGGNDFLGWVNWEIP